MKRVNYFRHYLYSHYERIEARESEYLYITGSQIPGSGKGLYTAIPIWKNEIISLFKGEILSHEEASERAKKSYDKYFINMLNGDTMDSMNSRCFAKFANDSEGFIKSGFRINSIIALDENDSICLVAKRNIKAGEEIFCSYGKKYWRKFEKDSFENLNDI